MSYNTPLHIYGEACKQEVQMYLGSDFGDAIAEKSSTEWLDEAIALIGLSPITFVKDSIFERVLSKRSGRVTISRKVEDSRVLTVLIPHRDGLPIPPKGLDTIESGGGDPYADISVSSAKSSSYGGEFSIKCDPTPESIQNAEQLVTSYVERYNTFAQTVNSDIKRVFLSTAQAAINRSASRKTKRVDSVTEIKNAGIDIKVVD